MVSIVVPVYNMGQFLSRAIDSFLMQSEKRIEIIICNNNSTDDTESIVQSYDDTRIVYIRHDTNIGMVNNFNSGLKVARGKYIIFISCDEFLIGEDSLSRRVDLLESDHEVDLVWCGYDFETDAGEIVSFDLKWPEQNIMPAPLTIDALFKDKEATNFRVTTVLFRRQLLAVNNYSNPVFHSGDMYVVLIWLMYSRNAAFISDVLHRSFMHLEHKHDFFGRVSPYLGERDFLLIRFIDEWKSRLIAMNLPIMRYEIILLNRMIGLLPTMATTEFSNFFNYFFFIANRYIVLIVKILSSIISYPLYWFLRLSRTMYLKTRKKLSKSKILRKLLNKKIPPALNHD